MPINVIMPQMGESILEGTVTKWLKKAGERVRRDESLFEVSTDKVDSEVPSPADGILSEILVQEGETVKVGTLMALIAEAEAAEAETSPPVEPAVEPVAPPAPIEETVVPAASEIEPAESAPEPAPPEAAPETRVAAPDAEKPEPPSGFIHTSPLVRRIAREKGIPLSEIQGTGVSGRITTDDIFAYMERRATKSMPPPESEAPAAAPPQPAIEEPPQPAIEEPPQPAIEEPPAEMPAVETPKFFGDTEVVSMTPMRRGIAEHMVLSRRTSAHAHTVFEVDMTAIVELRDKHAAEFEARQGIKLTYTPFIVKALVDTVRDYPVLNSSISEDKIIFKKPVNVGIAVALETGLLVPVIRDAQLKSLTGLALSIHDLAARARSKRLKPDEVQHGTITVTNPGIFGSLFGIPIINQPQVAILAVGGMQKRPVIIHDAIAIRTMVYLVLSFDHRIVDGATADQAMSALKSRLQAWDRWVE